jgi:hypothetical protein
MSGFDRMKTRIASRGESADDRIVKDKYDSFQAALKRPSYQSETITLLDKEGKLTDQEWRCLINPSRLTEQFDKKVISIDYAAGLKEGDVFYWNRTGLYWLVNLQQHTEEAYFRGTITRAEFEIEIEGRHYWAILKGPDETTTDWREKHQIWFNNLNLSMSIEIAKNSSTINYFKRHNIVKMKQTYPDVDTDEIITEEHRWKVVATDKYSSDKTIQVYLQEYFDNEMEDQQIVPEEPVVDKMNPYIEGPSAVNPFDQEIPYAVVGLTGGRWGITNTKAVKIVESNEKECCIDVITSKSGSFKLIYRTEDGTQIEKDIIIKSF